MRKFVHPYLDRYRTDGPFPATPPGADYGYFRVPIKGAMVTVISSGSANAIEDGWEHVSVSLPSRIPTWDEMNFVKDLFWGEEETVIQFHPKKSQYVNACENCLHLWKRIGTEHELPPKRLLA